MISNLPSIDIIVPTYNRPKDISKFVEEIQKQSYPNFKVYIIDDHGDLKIDHFIPENEQYVYNRLDKNIGQAGARNVAIKMGSGDIVISLDDDAWFLNDDQALQKTANYFNRFQDLACLMFDIIEPEKDFLSKINKLDDADEIAFHITCGCAYRRRVLENIGGFSSFFHSGAEETDITFKILKYGFKLRFSENIKVFHNFRPGERSNLWYRKYRRNTTRNDLLLVFMYYPILFVVPYFLAKWFSQIEFSLLTKRDRAFTTSSTILAGFESIFLLPKVLKFRNSLSKQEFIYWKKNRI